MESDSKVEDARWLTHNFFFKNQFNGEEGCNIYSIDQFQCGKYSRFNKEFMHRRIKRLASITIDACQSFQSKKCMDVNGTSCLKNSQHGATCPWSHHFKILTSSRSPNTGTRDHEERKVDENSRNKDDDMEYGMHSMGYVTSTSNKCLPCHITFFLTHQVRREKDKCFLYKSKKPPTLKWSFSLEVSNSGDWSQSNGYD